MFTLYSLYNNEGTGQYTLIYDQSSTMVNMARWMRQGKDNQFLEYPLDENGTPTGEELHSTNGFKECDSYVDTIQYARPMRDNLQYTSETLYQKKTGELFIHGAGGAMTGYSESCGDGNWSGGSVIIPECSFGDHYIDIKEWVSEYCDVETYIKLFGPVAE